MEMSIRRKILENERKHHNLTDLLLEELIDKEEYNIRKSWLKEHLIILNEKLDEIKNQNDVSIDTTEKIFDLIIWVKEKFNKWSLKDKKHIFSTFGENFVLKDKILAIELHP